MDSIFDLLILAFFGRGELLMCHSELCRLVSGSYSKIHDSSHVLRCLKKNCRHSRCAHKRAGSTHSFGFPCVRWWGFWNQLCTNFLHALGQNIVDSWVIQIQLTTHHYDCQRSIRPHRSPALATFSSVFEMQGLPERGSSATSKNALCRLQTSALNTTCSP